MNNNNSKYETISNEYIKGKFKADIGITIQKKDQWINISLAIFNGLSFKSNGNDGMSIALYPQVVKELIQKLQYASDLQFNEIKKQEQEEK